MGSPDEPGHKSIDASVGGLVWVRRRNGSWWPGRIMGLDEVSEGCLVTPRSGTPVKLLGREDASIDWYNLEKSKRVKSFRCGEYDECIEKAKASAASANKKAVKYARRDDAILHALEIESAQVGNDDPDHFSTRDNSGGEDNGFARESPSMSNSGKDTGEMTDEGSDSGNGSDSTPELSRSGITFEEPNHISSSRVQAVQGKRKTPNDSEDDGIERNKRMRGLEDLGMGVVAKEKVQAGTLLEHVERPNASPHDSNTGSRMPTGSAMKGSRSCFSTMKRKRSQVVNVHDLLKRKSRCRPLTQVLESSAMLSIPVVCDELPSSNGSTLCEIYDNKVLGVDSLEPSKSFSMVKSNNYSDCTGVSCENGIPLNASDNGADACHTNNKIKDSEISSISTTADNVSSDKLPDVPFLGGNKPSPDFSPEFVYCSPEIPDASSLGMQSNQIIKAENGGQTELGSTSTQATNVSISQRIENDGSQWQSKGKRNSRQTNQNKKLDSRQYLGMDDRFPQCSDQKVDSNGVSELKPHLTARSRYQTADIPVRSGDSSLHDVKVEANSRCRKQDVPLVSLVSKFNGKAIVGHPLTVEVLNDVLQSNECNVTEEVGQASKRKLEAQKVRRRRFKSGSRRSSGKSRKQKKNGLLSKKIRKLSALSGHKLDESNRNLVMDNPKAPVIACVPLKIVFSRINEAVNGSARQTHRTSTPANP